VSISKIHCGRMVILRAVELVSMSRADVHKEKLEKRITKIVHVLSRATRDFDVPLGTAMAQAGRTPFELLVATMCSAQAKDVATQPRMLGLFQVANTPEQFMKLPIAKLRKLLYPISYYNTKARHLKAMSRLLIDEFHGEVPQTMDELLRLPGVGRKTANLVLTESFGIVAGICVDTHVHRIVNRLGLIRTKTREQTERALMKMLPKRYWARWNPLLVTWGQNVCAPISPKCSTCPLRSLCEQRGVTTRR
jgi:endonuclease III